MKRSNFLKSILGLSALAALPTKVDASYKNFSFDEIFRTGPHNDNLIYVRPESKVYEYICSAVKDRVLPGNKFRCYYPKHDMVIPIKQRYSLDDFIPLHRVLNGVYCKNEAFSEWEQGVFFRLIICHGQPDVMYLDLFLADKR